jgi:hypothetical protein
MKMIPQNNRTICQPGYVGGISGSEKQLFPTQSPEIGYIDLPSRNIKRALVRA